MVKMKDIVFEVDQEKCLHKATYGPHRVSIVNPSKRMSKMTKEYLKDRIETLIEFRDDVGRKRPNGN